jgi:hypothetical protein
VSGVVVLGPLRVGLLKRQPLPERSKRNRKEGTMRDQFTPLQVGERVRTPMGSLGTVYGLPKRAAADIRRATTERECDMGPYTVQLDRDRSFTTYRGHELDRTDA